MFYDCRVCVPLLQVVEYAENIVPSMDGEVRRAFQRTLGKQGMKFKLGTKVNSAKIAGGKVQLAVEPAKGGAGAFVVKTCSVVRTFYDSAAFFQPQLPYHPRRWRLDYRLLYQRKALNPLQARRWRLNCSCLDYHTRVNVFTRCRRDAGG